MGVVEGREGGTEDEGPERRCRGRREGFSLVDGIRERMGGRMGVHPLSLSPQLSRPF